MINEETKTNRSDVAFFCCSGVGLSLVLILLMYPYNILPLFILATCLLTVEVTLYTRFYLTGGIAKAWNKSAMVTIIVLGFLFTYLSIHGILFRKQSINGNTIPLWLVYIVSCLPLWRLGIDYMRKIKDKALERGRYNLQDGIFYPFIMLSPQTKLGKWFVVAGPIFGGLAIYLGFHFRRTHTEIEGLISGILLYCVGGVCWFAASCAYHELRFIRQWEKETGRTMYVAGFGPDIVFIGGLKGFDLVANIARKIMAILCWLVSIFFGIGGLIYWMIALMTKIENINRPEDPMKSFVMGTVFLLIGLPLFIFGLFLFNYGRKKFNAAER